MPAKYILQFSIAHGSCACKVYIVPAKKYCDCLFQIMFMCMAVVHAKYKQHYLDNVNSIAVFLCVAAGEVSK